MIYAIVRGAVRISCDACDFEPEDVGFEDFREAAAWARQNGWLNRKGQDEEWETLCPICARKQQQGRRI